MDNSRPIIKSKNQRRREAALLREAADPAAASMTPAQVQMMIDAAVKAALAAVATTPAAPANVLTFNQTPPAIQTLSHDELKRLLVIEEARIANEASASIIITPNPTDTSHLPPVGERSSTSVQAPPRKWGNPQWAAGFKLS